LTYSHGLQPVALLVAADDHENQGQITMTSLPPAAHAAVIQDDDRPLPTGSTEERRELWSASEGQVANAHIYLLAIVMCWLVVPVFYAFYRYLRTANHRYILTDQRLVEESGIFVKNVESVELYRVKDLSVSGTLAQTIFGRGRVIVQSTDTTSPTLLVNAVPDAIAVSHLVRETVERCRAARGVRAFDF
jgi:membrane protein YdbS with pleckstrin-like domain